MSKSVKDFGAYGDNVHDDYSAFQRAFDSGEREIIIPQGIYCISKTLRVHSDTHINASKNAKIVMKSTETKKINEFLLSNSNTENGNTNIKITGGIWDGNNQEPNHKKPDIFDKTGYSGALLNFVNVDGLELYDMVLANTVTYYVRTSRLHNFRIENISFISDKRGENQDGLHFGGDVKHGYVKNIRALSYGQTTDDMIALNADDSIERVENLGLCRDAIEDITFENIYAENCLTIIRMLSVTAPIRNIRFKNIYAGFYGTAINTDAARYCRTPIFNEDDYPEGVGEIRDIYIENFTCIPSEKYMEDGTKMFPTVALRLETRLHNFNVSGFRYIADEEAREMCPAVVAKNLVNQEMCIDGKNYMLTQKSDCIKIPDFETFSANLK